MKNFLLVEAPATRTEMFLLLKLAPDIDDNQREFEPFTHYAKWLSRRGYSRNTIQSYSEHAARFIDYLYEASFSKTLRTENLDICEVIFSYQSYMLFGTKSPNPLAQELAERLGKKRTTSPTSIAQPIQSSVRWFLETTLLRAESGHVDSLFGILIEPVSRRRSSLEVSKVRQNSWMAGTIRDSLSRAIPTTRRGSIFPSIDRRSGSSKKKSFQIRAFPIEYSVDLVGSKVFSKGSRKYRDLTLYALLAATGIRVHEALQIRMQDIIVDSTGNQRIELHSPFSRATPGVSEDEFKKLSWKGRDTERTFMIEPFASIFFDHLENYLKLEYNSSVSHDFLFQSISGRPFFTSDRQSRDKTFRKYARLSGIENCQGICLHSLRHMYGTYLLNYIPVLENNATGLPMFYVQRLMGHATLSSTERYAKHDEEIIDAYIEHANNYVLGKDNGSLEDTRKKFHMRQIELIEAELASKQ